MDLSALLGGLPTFVQDLIEGIMNIFLQIIAAFFPGA